ncbi:MAG: hypothetical protein SGI71_06645 [Verrucomicrobiota bacterium]|nr:hypothetical protein [Verrucomicrobiota bacterium]
MVQKKNDSLQKKKDALSKKQAELDAQLRELEAGLEDPNAIEAELQSIRDAQKPPPTKRTQKPTNDSSTRLRPLRRKQKQAKHKFFIGLPLLVIIGYVTFQLLTSLLRNP